MKEKGNFVKSVYSARWKGVILHSEDRRYRKAGNLLTVLILLSATGKPMRKRKIVYYDEHWFVPCEALDISKFNKDWFKHD